MRQAHFDNHDGGVHHSAIVGHPPEIRGWEPGDKYRAPHIHPTARVGAFCTIDAGTFRPTTVGARSWLMKNVHVGHDVLIGEDCEVAPQTVVGGEVSIGDNVKIGINATIRPCVTVGDGARIGCGAVVVKDVPAGETWAGNPARKL